jgi:ATP-binding cassette subfamily F protein 3
MIRLLLEPVNLLILDEPTNHLDMPSKDVLKEAIRAFDGTAILVSHDREFLDGLVTKVFEFGGGKVREHLGGIYDWINSHPQGSNTSLRGEGNTSPQREEPKASPSATLPSGKGTATSGEAYLAHKEQQKRLRKAERAVEESEKKIAKMEQRLKELDQLLSDPKNACDMTLVSEYTDTKRQLDDEVERWEKLSDELEELTNN